MEIKNNNIYFYGLQNVTLSNTGKNRLSKFTSKFETKFPSIYENAVAIIDIAPFKKVGNYKIYNGIVGLFVGDQITKACYIGETPIVCDLSNCVVYIKELNLACSVDSATQKINSNDFLTLKNAKEVKFPKDLNNIISDLNSNERSM